MGVHLDSVEHGAVEASLELKDSLLQQNGVAHGGVLMALSDIVAGFAAFTVVEKGQHVVTANITVNCLRPAREKLYARGEVIKAGRNIIFCQSHLFSESDKNERILVATSTSAMAIAHRLG